MFNPIFKGKGQKHPWRCAFVDPELLSYRKSKHVAQNEINGHKNLNNNNHNLHDEIELFQWINKRTHNETQQQNNALRQNSPINYDGVQLTNEQCHMVPIFMLLLKMLNYTIRIYTWNPTGKNKSIISSNTPSWPHQLLVCICPLERAYFNYSEGSYITWYVYGDHMTIRTRTKVVGRKHIIQATSLALIPRPASNKSVGRDGLFMHTPLKLLVVVVILNMDIF